MALNIEIKARIRDIELIRDKLSQLKKEIFRQKDTFISQQKFWKIRLKEKFIIERMIG
jgi:hypothetical protein